jgi:hypothetical protein
VKHGLHGVRSIANHALDHIRVRSLLLCVRAQARACLDFAHAIAAALDRSSCAIERTNKNFTLLGSILPFKPRFHCTALQHTKTLK